MILIQEGIRKDDIVFFSFSIGKDTIKNKLTKKTQESEFRILENSDRYLKLQSTSGQYQLIFNRECLNSFYGNCRKV